MDKITREKAAAEGLKHYYTGKPCRNKHLAKRYVTNEACSECIKESRERGNDRIKAARGAVAVIVLVPAEDKTAIEQVALKMRLKRKGK